MTTAAPPFTGLGEVHRHYLEQRGLTADTIAAAGFYSARPSDLPRLAGRPVPDETSGLVIPYPNAAEFCRVRLFPPIATADGKSKKFGQPQGTGVRAYIPPEVQSVLQDPSVFLMITEGEVKALALMQAGWSCIGMGGVWNFRCKELPRDRMIEDLEGIAWHGRIVYLVPDSDAWTKEQVLLAVFTLARLLEDRGATVLIVRLPALQGQETTGADDFLVTKGSDAFRRLVEKKATTLGDSAFRPFREREKRQAKQTQPSADAMKLLERIEQVRLIRPAQDFIDGIFLFGVPVGDDVAFITSERKAVLATDLPKEARLDNRGFDLCRFSKEGISRFLGGATVAGHELLRKLERFFARFIVFRDARLPLLLAAWTIGTYSHRVFRVYPYLALRSPTKRCGKTRVLDLLSLVAFNASPKTLNPTEAQLFRGPSKNAGTLLLDEVEQLRGDKETFQGLQQVLNSGFEKGGVVTRLERTKEGHFKDVSFPTYCPRALAGISRMAETLEDRSLIIFMARKLRTERVERFSPGRLEGEAQDLRDACYTWALTHAADLAEVYEADAFPGLNELDDRARDLWEPLLSITLLADAEAQEIGWPADFAKTLTALALDLCGVRDEGDTTTARLVEALEAIVEEEQRESFTPTELLKFIKAREGFDWLRSTRALAGLLNPLGLMAQHDKIPVEGRRKTVRHYHLGGGLLADLWRRYGSPEETPEEAQ